MATATLETISDRIVALIEATATAKHAVRFRAAREDEAEDFETWAVGQQDASFRRFSVDSDGTDDLPPVSNGDVEEHRATMIVLIAYPHTNRTGPKGRRDRKAAMDADFKRINFQIGLHSRGNFTGSHDCTPRGATKDEYTRSGVDFLRITATYLYSLDVDA